MLVLTRRIDESIILTLPDGERIKVQLVALKSNQARIGIKSPDSVSIVREELLDDIDNEKNYSDATFTDRVS